jgi:hypothetical protein
VIRVEVLDADVVSEKHRWMEGEGAIVAFADRRLLDVICSAYYRYGR